MVWNFTMDPLNQYLTHHSFFPMENSNVLLLVWDRKTKEEALAAGRRPDLIPDGEVWDNWVVEVQPDGAGGADIVWQWRMWDHLVQDYDSTKANFGVVEEHPELYDINYCVQGGKCGARNLNALNGDPADRGMTFGSGAPKSGERDWLHVNSVGYDAVRDQIVLSLNIESEIIIIDHSTSTV